MSNKFKTWCDSWTESSLAFLILRLWLGLRALLTGIEKFAGVKIEKKEMLDEFGLPDPSGMMVEVKTKVYGFAHYHAVPTSLAEAFEKEPLLPAMLLKPYYAVLGYALIVLGVMLLLGLFTRSALFLLGLLFVSLTVGLILIGQDGGIAWLGTHILLTAAALVLAKHNRLALTQRF